MSSSEDKFEQWAVVELFGHARIAGLVSEFSIGGNSFIRVDVPAVNGRQPFTKLYGQGAIYAVSFVDRDVALAAADKLQAKPVDQYALASVTAEAVRNRLELANRPHSQEYSDWEEDVL